jgi:hypothetical protein
MEDFESHLQGRSVDGILGVVNGVLAYLARFLSFAELRGSRVQKDFLAKGVLWHGGAFPGLE